MFVLSKESGGNYNVGCIPVDIQNYLGSTKESCFKMEMPRECTNILLRVNVKIQTFFCN